ncbi:hypothetical protein LTS18_011836, partial [Coniosporium uncinatum]
MFYRDDPENAATADYYGIVAGTSHTEPMTLATNEQRAYLNGTWAWNTNRENVTDLMRVGAERAEPYETLFTMGMRGLGDEASPTLNASSLQQIVATQQDILRDVYNLTNVSSIPQMWCLYKEVGGYLADGLQAPDDVTLLWADDNWSSMQRLPLANETSRSGGAGIYYHADYVGDPRDYKWINTISLQKYWQELQQAYERKANRIWMLNVGDLKGLELPISYFLDMAYDAPARASPNDPSIWLAQWASQSFGASLGNATADIMSRYSIYAARRKYELVDPSTYSLINYNEAESVLQQWTDLTNDAQSIYDRLDPSLQPAFFEMILHPCLAAYTLYSIHIGAARNNLYAMQRRTSANIWAQQ